MTYAVAIAFWSSYGATADARAAARGREVDIDVLVQQVPQVVDTLQRTSHG